MELKCYWLKKYIFDQISQGQVLDMTLQRNDPGFLLNKILNFESLKKIIKPYPADHDYLLSFLLAYWIVVIGN